MASKAFFDPIALLRVAPLVTSTCACWFSLDQFAFLNNFLNPVHREKANAIVPSYFQTFFRRGLPAILTLYSLSIGTGIGNFWGKPNGAWGWYATGTALAVFHMVFVPVIGPSILALTGDPKDQGNARLKEWLNIHSVRSVVADFPAWVCFGIAALKSIQPI